jgi:hypothetical protein
LFRIAKYSLYQKFNQTQTQIPKTENQNLIEVRRSSLLKNKGNLKDKIEDEVLVFKVYIFDVSKIQAFRYQSQYY